MRLLFILLLLTASHYANASAVICPDGITYTDSAENKCPAYRTGLGVVNVGETSATLAGTMDSQGAGSTAYHWTAATQFPPGCSALNYTYADLASGVTATRQAAEKARQKCMNWKTMVAGTGAVVYGSASVPTAGSFTVPITGLTANTTYYTQEFAMGGTLAGAGKVSVMSTQAFTTEVASTGEALTGLQRFIKDDGNNSNDGLTDATAKLTLAAGCPGSLQAGTDCNLKTGDTWSERMTVSHSGLSDNYSVIRCYKMDGGSPYECGSGDTKPILLGTMDQTKLTNGTEDYRTSAFTGIGSEASSEYTAMYRVNATADYTEHRNIEIKNFRAIPIVASGDVNTPAGLQGATGALHHVKFVGMKIFNAANSLMVIEHSVSDVVIRDSNFSFYNTCEMQRFQTGTSLTEMCNGGGWPGGISIPRGVTRILVENNDISNGFGEALNCFASPNALGIYRLNRISNLLSGAFYADSCTDVVVENNIMVGNRGTAGGIGYASGSGNEWGGALAANVEVSSGVSNARIVWRNNLTVGPGWCWSADSYTATRSSEVKVFGNTCVDPVTAAISSGTGGPVTFNAQNNVVWSDRTAAQICDVNGTNTTETFVDNHWSASVNPFTMVPSDAECVGAGDTTGDPGLTVSTYATWAAYSYLTTLPTFANAAPTGGAAIKDNCTYLNAAMLTAADFGFALDNVAAVLAGTITKANWVLQNVYDANDTLRTATCSKGAVE